ncbi:hypothetical protein [Herbaspirillum chlorophenolicum]|uniref:hypothetical protein n=1 Tax=Herbaspirillum chlorophenolicum TaxID=211589 RepID=UPI00067C8314|nr:hypothetical protein [Herbaspirillum chlorophenolicum]
MQTPLRTVQVYRYAKDPETGKHDYLPAEQGLFHGWGVEFMEFEAGPGNYSVAIVEFIDGKVETFAPAHVRFTDGGAK